MIEVELAKLILLEAAILLALSYKTAVRKPIKRALNRLINVEAAYILLIVFIIGSLFLALSISSLIKIHLRAIREASIDYQLIQSHKLLQASLLGRSLILISLCIVDYLIFLHVLITVGG